MRALAVVGEMHFGARWQRAAVEGRRRIEEAERRRQDAMTRLRAQELEDEKLELPVAVGEQTPSMMPTRTLPPGFVWLLTYSVHVVVPLCVRLSRVASGVACPGRDPRV